mgnify:FL=1
MLECFGCFASRGVLHSCIVEVSSIEFPSIVSLVANYGIATNFAFPSENVTESCIFDFHIIATLDMIKKKPTIDLRVWMPTYTLRILLMSGNSSTPNLDYSGNLIVR